MRFLAGWIAGLATAWTVLAIWRRIPGLDDDPAYDWQGQATDGYVRGRPGYHDSVAGG